MRIDVWRRRLYVYDRCRVPVIYSPDRLSRKYAYQVLLSEELSRCGVELIFLKAPAGATPEDQLLVQFQGQSQFQSYALSDNPKKP